MGPQGIGIRYHGLLWLVYALGLSLLGIVAVGCGDTKAIDYTSGERPPAVKELGVDRITYVDSQGDLFTISPDGSDLWQVMGDAQVREGRMGNALAHTLDLNNFYAWPTWSPDGTKLAVSLVQVSGNQAEVSLQVINPLTGQSRTVYNNEGSRLVADGAPHHHYWTPDSRPISFLASTPDGLTLFVQDTETRNEPVTVETNAPLYSIGRPMVTLWRSTREGKLR